MPHVRSSVIASFVEHPGYKNFQMYSVLILLFDFVLPLLTQILDIKVICSWNFGCSSKEAVMLLLSWSTLYIAFPNCIVSWFYFFYFDLPLFTQSASLKVISSGTFCSSFVEHPVYNIFKVYSVLILVVLLWFATVYPRCMCKTHLFWKFWVLHERSSDIFSFV